MSAMSENQNEEFFLTLAERLSQNVKSIKYGVVSVELVVHDGRVVTTTHSVTEKTRVTEK